MRHKHLLYTNLTGIPTNFFASPAFNFSPVPVHINSVIEMNAPLFEVMSRAGKDEIPHLFMEHMRVIFGLDEKPGRAEERKYRANYLRLLRGWFFDSNRPEGAVMKGWAESRFGLMPLFHREPIPDINCTQYWDYMTHKMNSRFHNNAILSQFDLLYEYAQYYLQRFGPRRGKFTLYRGCNRHSEDQQVVEARGKRLWVVRNNSLVSYTSEKERACEFGDVILEVDVPFEKILCLPELLPGKLSSSEREFIILGGDYVSRVMDIFS